MNWMSPKKASEYLRQNFPDTMIGEHTIRAMIKLGFPCVKINTRCLINIDTFAEDLKKFSEKEKAYLN